jgi:hypothetical protein
VLSEDLQRLPIEHIGLHCDGLPPPGEDLIGDSVSPGHVRVSYHYHGRPLLAEGLRQRTAQHTTSAHHHRHFPVEIEWPIQVHGVQPQRQSIK